MHLYKLIYCYLRVKLYEERFDQCEKFRLLNNFKLDQFMKRAKMVKFVTIQIIVWWTHINDKELQHL